MKWRAEITIGLPGHSQQEVGDGIAGEGAIELESAAAERSEEGVEQESPDVETKFHRVLTCYESHVLDVVIRVVVPPLGQVGRTADRRIPGHLNLRRSIVERRHAGIGQAADSERLNDVDVAVLLQAVEAESCVADARFVDKARRKNVRPHHDSMLRSLELVATPSRHIAR